jgi:hypothetical protein
MGSAATLDDAVCDKKSWGWGLSSSMADLQVQNHGGMGSTTEGNAVGQCGGGGGSRRPVVGSEGDDLWMVRSRGASHLLKPRGDKASQA